MTSYIILLILIILSFLGLKYQAGIILCSWTKGLNRYRFRIGFFKEQQNLIQRIFYILPAIKYYSFNIPYFTTDAGLFKGVDEKGIKFYIVGEYYYEFVVSKTLI